MCFFIRESSTASDVGTKLIQVTSHIKWCMCRKGGGSFFLLSPLLNPLPHLVCVKAVPLQKHLNSVWYSAKFQHRYELMVVCSMNTTPKSALISFPRSLCHGPHMSEKFVVSLLLIFQYHSLRYPTVICRKSFIQNTSGSGLLYLGIGQREARVILKPSM